MHTNFADKFKAILRNQLLLVRAWFKTTILVMIKGAMGQPIQVCKHVIIQN